MSCNASGQACCPSDDGQPNYCQSDHWVLCNNGTPETCADCGKADPVLPCCNPGGHAKFATADMGFCQNTLCGSDNNCSTEPCGQLGEVCCEPNHPGGQ